MEAEGSVSMLEVGQDTIWEQVWPKSKAHLSSYYISKETPSAGGCSAIATDWQSACAQDKSCKYQCGEYISVFQHVEQDIKGVQTMARRAKLRKQLSAWDTPTDILEDYLRVRGTICFS